MAVRLESIVLDYGEAGAPKLLANLSAAVLAGDVLWTASDEGRTVEALAPHADGYRLVRQLRLDDLFPDLPPGEADLESLACDGGRLWLCGSHCRSRRKGPDGLPTSEIEDRPGRRLFGCALLRGGSQDLHAPGTHAPVHGPGGLRLALQGVPLLEPVLDLPTKEGGLDVEGIAVSGVTARFGLRGPVIDGKAVIAEVRVAHDAALGGDPVLHLLDLGGLAVRDLAREGDGLLVLAGPMDSADGPFRIHRWRPGQAAAVVHEFPTRGERPEALCRLRRGGAQGVLVLYDQPDPSRVQGSTYRADWLALE